MYCGKGPVPKNKRRGTAAECRDLGQIRYYGIEQIPEDLPPRSLFKVEKELVDVNGTIAVVIAVAKKRLKQKAQLEANLKKKYWTVEQKNKSQKELNKINKELEKFKMKLEKNRKRRDQLREEKAKLV